MNFHEIHVDHKVNAENLFAVKATLVYQAFQSHMHASNKIETNFGYVLSPPSCRLNPYYTLFFI